MRLPQFAAVRYRGSMMLKKINEAATLLCDFGRALHERRLTLDYQPKIDLISGKVAGVEAQGYYIASALHGGDREAFLAALGKD
ncbi:MAG TPA: hypothetical protein VFH21_02460 [Burkholderiales bacterium]|nr:hypothetical protein [Burkholderiales bacterium]